MVTTTSSTPSLSGATIAPASLANALRSAGVEPDNQSVNQSINQSITQSINQSINQSIKSLTKPATGKEKPASNLTQSIIQSIKVLTETYTGKEKPHPSTATRSSNLAFARYCHNQ